MIAPTAEHVASATPVPTKPRLQASLKVGALDDPLEREAEAVAERVLRTPDPAPALAAGSLSGCPDEHVCRCPGGCPPEGCGDDALYRRPWGARQGNVGAAEAGGPPQLDAATASAIQARRVAGQPLPPVARSFFERRLGAALTQVRVHTDSAAAALTRRVRARAFTVGQDVFFGAGEYAPTTLDGRRLLAHELAHVLQQSGPHHHPTSGSQSSRGHGMMHATEDATSGRTLESSSRHAYLPASDAAVPNSSQPPPSVTATMTTLRRACGPISIGSPSGCIDAPPIFESGRFFEMFTNCDDPEPSEEASLVAFVSTQPAGTTFEIHGYASERGDLSFNLHLSCARGIRADSLIGGLGAVGPRPVFRHGETPGPADAREGVVIVAHTPAPISEPDKVCGPDTTGWFLDQVAAAKRDPDVLFVRSRLAGAARVAARHGFSAERIAEGAVAKKVLAEETRAGGPARTPEATSQLRSSAPGQREFGRAVIAATVPIAGAPEAMVLAAVRAAALSWRNLVGTGRRYDFKNDPRTMQHPTTASCPIDCPSTITLCPTVASHCFLTDVPGNLFYAHIGRFVGWTELSLQLGSQFAQLASTLTWDPPEDTRMVSIGFAMPDPLTQSAFCSTIAAHLSSFTGRECAICAEESTAQVV